MPAYCRYCLIDGHRPVPPHRYTSIHDLSPRLLGGCGSFYGRSTGDAMKLYSGKVFRVFRRTFRSPVLTPHRVRCAYVVAVTTDVLQLLLGPFGWAFADELLDLAAMVLTGRLIGFHPLLLPTFVLEFVPLADMLPSWTVCVA